MATIYQERFDIGPETVERLIGVHVFHRPSYPPMRNRGLFMCGISHAPGRFEVERIDPPFHVVLLPLAGQGELFGGEASRPVGPGEVGVLPARGRWGLRRTGEAPWHLVWFLLYDTPRWQHLQGVQPRVQRCADAQLLHDAVAVFHHEALRHLQQPSQAFAARALIVVTGLIERSLAPLHPDTGWSARLQSLFRRVDEQLGEPWTTEALAAQLQITPAHLHRLCRHYLGMAPGQYLMLLRMRRARELLLAGLGVGQTAAAVGYLEVASFSRRFTRHFGHNPSRLKPAAPGFVAKAEAD
ncbi:helix-turn-helix transcriptional regulator [Chitiniphilus purpureus]|uniref:Helix-turn-helix transcriptional regulator n=1 Tax=Chitiniphilus purpureus TaxID=2981137 RepID=A0ABY6DM59_9NEIS|nr:helix-turn-helix transcriptional regulator [Chitiniphilus sp. CD1]UXY15455.1 helix-turn-helix transcriptional regulator [Chitiniphilus sp. CD1]